MSMRSKRLRWTVVISIIAGLFWCVLPRRDDGIDAELDELSVEGTAGSAERESEPLQPDELAPSAASAQVSAAPPPTQTTPASPAIAAGEVDDLYARQVQLLNDSLDQGGRDAWARDTEAQLRQTLEQLRAGNPGIGELADVSCSSSLCRVRLLPDATEGLEAVVPALRANLEWSGERFFTITAGDPVEIRMFASREGHTLPRAEAAPQNGI